MANVFVSYARANGEIVRALVDELRELGYEAKFDQNLIGGQRWWNELLDQIHDADGFLPVLSDEYRQSEACHREAHDRTPAAPAAADGDGPARRRAQPSSRRKLLARKNVIAWLVGAAVATVLTTVLTVVSCATLGSREKSEGDTGVGPGPGLVLAGLGPLALLASIALRMITDRRPSTA